MAKKIQIFFVYGTNKSKVDKSLEGLLYFYPEWVSDEQKGALCGQIIGTIQCMKNIFSEPTIITLQNGKFRIIESRSLFFVIGTDKHAPDIFLQYLAKHLCSSLQFFHLDETLETLPTSHTLLQKLHNVFDGYLKVLNFSEKMFSLSPPSKSSNNIFIEAMQFLECCRNFKYVLGGVIIYRNRLIATQFCTFLTHLLLLTATGNVQCPSILNKLQFDLPAEVQVYEVCISNKEYIKLLKVTEESKPFELLNKGSIKKNSAKSSQKHDNSVLSAMKREQSLIFTSVPEDESSPVFKPSHASANKKNRPRFLNLENTVPKSNLMKNVKQFTLQHSSSQIIVCNTPLQEQKKIVHFNPLLICNNELLDNKKVVAFNSTSNSRDKIPQQWQKPKFCAINSVGPLETKNMYYKTIADPTYPLFKLDGKLISVFLYEEKRVKDMAICSRYKDLESVYLSKEGTSRYPASCRRNSAHSKLNSVEIPALPSIPISSTFFKFKGSKDNKTPLLPKYNFDFKNSRKLTDNKSDETIQKCILFIWQNQDIVSTLLLKQEACEEKETFTALRDICVKYLNKLGNIMRTNIHLQKHQQEKEHNKFAILDSCSIVKSEDIFWNGTSDEWSNLNYFNEQLSTLNLGEVLIRSDENILYGYHCGSTKIFYSEISTCSGGLPLPTDPLGVLQVKAKRRLEKDCAFIMF